MAVTRGAVAADDAPPAEVGTRPAPGGVVAAAGAALVSVIGLGAFAADGDRGALGALRAQYPVAITVAFVLLGFAVWRPVAAALAGDDDVAPSYRARSEVRTWLLRIVPAAWLVMVVAFLFPTATGNAAPTGSFGGAAAGSTSVPLAAMARWSAFVAPYDANQLRVLSSPVAHLWPVCAAVAFCLLAPAIGALLVRRAQTAGGRARARRAQRTTVAGLAVVAVAWRLVTGAALPHRALLELWLPAHLDACAAGMALAIWMAVPPVDAPVRALDRAREALGRPVAAAVGVVVALAVLLGTAGLLGRRPFGPVLVGRDVLLARSGAVDCLGALGQHLAFVVAAVAVAAPLLLWRPGVRSPGRAGGRHLPSTAAVVAVAYGAYAWAPIVVGRWVSADRGLHTLEYDPVASLRAPHPSGIGDPARHVGLLFDVPVARTVAWTVVVTLVVAAVSWFAVQRPISRFERRPFGTFGGGMVLITLASFASRLWSFSGPTARNPGNGDPFYYHAQANMLADRVGFGEPIQWLTEHRFVPTAIHPPLFTLWLTPSSLLGARGFLSNKAMAGFAGLAVVVVAGFLGRRLAGDRAGLVAAALVALSPDLWIIDGTLWPEGLYTAMVGLALIGAYRWRDRPSMKGAALVGAAVGLAILTRGEAIFLLPILCLPLVWSRRAEVPRWWAHGLVMAVVALGLLAPWTIRNLATFDHVVPVSTNSEEVLEYANCPDVYSGPLIGFWSFNCQQRERARRVAGGLPADPPGDESVRAAAWGKLGRQYALAHKGRWPAVAWARFTRVWDLQHAHNTALALTFEGRPLTWSNRGLLAYRITLLPGLAGLYVLWRRRRAPVWPLLATMGMVTVTALSVYGHIRFRTIGDLVLLVAAGVAVDAALGWAQHRIGGGAAPAVEPETEPA